MAADQPTAKAGVQPKNKAGVQPKKAAKAKKVAKSAKKALKIPVRSAPAAGKGRVSHSSTLSRDEAVAYFEAIVGGLRSGSIRFRQGDRRVVLRLAERLTLAIKARDSGKKKGVSFELSWPPGDEAGSKAAPKG